jgi:3',5'-nucleoside bisphosphate phosphatase
LKKLLEFEPNVIIDLHIHTTASDGSFSPSEVLALAKEAHLAAIAVTDHDSTDGVKEILSRGDLGGIAFLPGVEITTQGPSDAGLSDSLHILGYGMDVENLGLGRLLHLLKDVRDDRTPRIVQALQKFGINISLEELAGRFPVPQLGRPHIAQLLIQKGYAVAMDDAFDRLLGKGKPGYVDKFRVTHREAIDAVRNAGGVAVLAHPYLCDLSDDGLDALIQRLKDDGIEGLEVYYPEHTAAQTRFYEHLSKTYTLLSTGGTDFHGDATPGIEIGKGRGDLRVPYFLYENILQALSCRTP